MMVLKSDGIDLGVVYVTHTFVLSLRGIKTLFRALVAEKENKIMTDKT